MIGPLLLAYILLLVLTATISATDDKVMRKRLHFVQFALAIVTVLLSLPRSTDWLYYVAFTLSLSVLYFVYLTYHRNNVNVTNGLLVFLGAGVSLLAAVATSNYRTPPFA